MKTTKFQVGPDPEKDVVPAETLLMKLAMAQAVFERQRDFITEIESSCGQVPGDQVPPDSWAVIGAFEALAEVSHALKCGCFGWPVPID